MQPGKLTIRRRVFVVCLCLSLLMVMVVGGLGVYFRQVLRERAVKKSEEIAAIFCKLATRRVGQLVAESWAIAQSPSDPVAHSGPDRVACSWALYDEQGGRTAGQHLGSDAARLAHLGIGSNVLPDRERRRAATESQEGPSMVIVPDDSRAYVLLYHAVRQGDSKGYLQTATEVSEATFSLISHVSSGQVVLRPFMFMKQNPRVELIHRKPHLIFHRSLQYAGRNLGTITAAVPYAKEAAYERNGFRGHHDHGVPDLRRRAGSEGFSYIEVFFAMLVLTLCITPAMRLAPNLISGQRDLETRYQLSL